MLSVGVAVISLTLLHQAYALQPLKATWLERDVQYASLKYQAQAKKGISFSDIKAQFPSIEVGLKLRYKLSSRFKLVTANSMRAPHDKRAP